MSSNSNSNNNSNTPANGPAGNTNNNSNNSNNTNNGNRNNNITNRQPWRGNNLTRGGADALRNFKGAIETCEMFVWSIKE